MNCIEVHVCKIHSGKVDDFISVNKVRLGVMKDIPGCIDVWLFKAPFLQDTFLRCVVWESKKLAMVYCGERFGKESYLDFLDEYVQEMTISFVDQVDLLDNEDVPEKIIRRFGG